MGGEEQLGTLGRGGRGGAAGTAGNVAVGRGLSQIIGEEGTELYAFIPRYEYMIPHK